ncbi:MAG: DUF1192 domain-containing protein [Alphaproteobacteria bacterium]
MDEEDLEPRHKAPKPRDLEPMSIEALGDYIAELESEIARVRGAIEAKENTRRGADAFFKK